MLNRAFFTASLLLTIIVIPAMPLLAYTEGKPATFLVVASVATTCWVTGARQFLAYRKVRKDQ